MKTLEEVIKALEVCTSDRGGCEGCPYNLDCKPDRKWDEAIHYLKEYLEQKEQIDALPDYYDLVNFWAESQANPPLTWDELKAMNGNPVWVEVDGKWWGRFWAFVEVANDAYMNFYQNGQEYPEDLWKRDIGKTWQAYRKERE